MNIGNGCINNFLFFWRVYDSTIDEVMISDKARGGDWINTTHNNQYSPSTFYTLGNEQKNRESYSDSAHTTVCNSFSGGTNRVYMNGSGFSSSQTLKVGYYDGGNALRETDTYSNGVTGGNLSSECYFPTYAGTATVGTWHAVVLQQAGNLPDTYAAAIADANYTVDDDFTVVESAIPEFPTAVAAIAVCMLCAVAYGVMRRRVVVR